MVEDAAERALPDWETVGVSSVLIHASESEYCNLDAVTIHDSRRGEQ